MLDVCCVPTSYDKYVALVKTGNACQLSAYMLLRGSVVPAKFPLCHSTRCLVCCMRNGARSAPRNLTRYRLSAYSRDLWTPHLWTAVCISQAKECFTTSMYCVCSILCCPCPCCTHNSSWFLGLHFAHCSDAVDCFTLIHGSTS